MPFSISHFFSVYNDNNNYHHNLYIIIIDMECIPMEMGRRNEMKLNETVNLQMKMLSGFVLKVN